MQNSFSVLSAMFTPAVLISACGALIFSTSTRLARIVDRVRELIRVVEEFSKMEFTLMLRAKHQQRREAALAEMEKEI
jgi:Protein of unknown function (DUF2721)